MSKLFICILTITFFFQHSCNNIRQNLKFNQNEDDSTYLSRIDSSKQLIRDFNNPSLYWTLAIDNNIIVFINPFRDYNFVSHWAFFIKEFGKDSIIRNFAHFNDNLLYNFPKYDSLEYDTNILCSFDKDLENKSYLEYLYYIADNKFTTKFSNSFYQLSEIKKKDVDFQKEIIKGTDIKKLEKIVNNIEKLKKFKLNNYKQVKLLKNLFILTQIQILTLNEADLNNYTYVATAFNMLNVYEIKSKNDLKFFEESIESVPKKYLGLNFVKYYWTIFNFQHLKEQMEYIRKDYQKDNTFYFYTKPDFKVFKLIIEIKDNKIILFKEHLNKEYLWFNYETAISNPNKVNRF